jgi:hypothetical protein
MNNDYEPKESEHLPNMEFIILEELWKRLHFFGVETDLIQFSKGKIDF